MQRLPWVVLLGAVLTSGGCGGDGARTGRIRMVPNVVAGAQSGIGTAALTLQQQAVRIGTPQASTLRSLKYYVTSIELCQNVEIMGTGFSNKSGCIELYANQGMGAPNYDSYMVEEARADTTPGRYVDLMTAEGQAALRRPVTVEVPVSEEGMGGGNGEPDMRAGAYRYGLINFYRPIKVTAEFPIMGRPGEYFRTRAVTGVRSNPIEGGRWTSQQVDIADSLSGPTEETTYMLNNGGVLFTFQQPFVITQADIDAGTEIKIDLVFNPDSFGQAYEMPGCSTDRNRFICDPQNQIALDMPFVRMNPVPRKSGERTRKETYLVDYQAGVKLRVELYYNDGDVQAGVQGVDLALVYQSDATTPAMNGVMAQFVSQTGSVSGSDAVVTLLDPQRVPSLSGLRRRQAGNASIHCSYPSPACPTPGGMVSKPYNYVGDSLVSAD